MWRRQVLYIYEMMYISFTMNMQKKETSSCILLFLWKCTATTLVLDLEFNHNLLEPQRLVPGHLNLNLQHKEDPIIITYLHSRGIWGTQEAIHMQT